jgi:putative addiction module killer protein
VIEIRQTVIFARWLATLRDRGVRARISVRIRRFEAGNPGNVKSVGDGVSEMRLDTGPGYRLYFTRRGTEVVILLCGGEKGSQSSDIARAKQLAKEW